MTSDSSTLPPRIKFIGVGGAGSRIVSTLHQGLLKQIPICNIDTDIQSLSATKTGEALRIGHSLTRGLGSGGNSEIGASAAQQDSSRIQAACQGYDCIFLVAGLGGGIGSGALPIIARIAAELGAFTFACTSLPFMLEGKQRRQQAETCLQKLYPTCDGVITLPNDILFQQLSSELTVLQAFDQANEWLTKAIHALCSLMLQPKFVSVDFATLKALLSNKSGKLVFSTARGTGPNAPQEALKNLDLCPFGGFTEKTKVDRLLIHLHFGPDLSIEAFNTTLTAITEKFKSHKQTFIGASMDEHLRNIVDICMIGPVEASVGRAYHPKHMAATNEAARLPNANQRNSTEALLPSSADEAFDLTSQESARGYFYETERNEWQGIDLDVPTFIRKNIKLRQLKKINA